MPNPVEGRFEVYEDMVEVLLVLEIFLTEDSWVEDLLCGAPSCSEAPSEASDGKHRQRQKPWVTAEFLICATKGEN